MSEGYQWGCMTRWSHLPYICPFFSICPAKKKKKKKKKKVEIAGDQHRPRIRAHLGSVRSSTESMYANGRHLCGGSKDRG